MLHVNDTERCCWLGAYFSVLVVTVAWCGVSRGSDQPVASPREANASKEVDGRHNSEQQYCHGILRDASKQMGLSGVRIEIVKDSRPIAVTWTDAKGTFRIEIPDSGPITIRSMHELFEPHELLLESTTALQPLEIELQPYPVWQVECRGDNGTPMANGIVIVSGGNAAELAVRLDREGRGRVARPLGEYHFHGRFALPAKASNGGPTRNIVNVDLGQINIVSTNRLIKLNIPKLHMVTVTIVGENHEDARIVQVLKVSETPSPIGQCSLLSGSGQLMVPTGEYRFRIVREDGASWTNSDTFRVGDDSPSGEFKLAPSDWQKEPDRSLTAGRPSRT